MHEESTRIVSASFRSQSGDARSVASDGKSYANILRSSTIIGGSSIISVLVGIVRVKVNAILLGLGGVGLFGIYNSITEFANALSGMGVRTSGVRQIAVASATGDAERLSRTVTVLRRLVLIFGVAGGIGLFIMRKGVCEMTFGNGKHQNEVGALALVILFGAISAGQSAIVQGMRRIGDLARISMIGALLGTLLSTIIIVLMRERGIAISLVAVSAMGILTSWWYARKVRVKHVTVGWEEFRNESGQLLSLGFVNMASGLMGAGLAYMTRLLIVRQIGMDAVGLYQSASTLSLIYVGFILQAMGMDFFPRLAAAAKDHVVCNRLVNEQAEIGLLLAVPGILATLAFAPLVISLFYSPRFAPAADVLRWQILGMLLRVATWPMSFILQAKGLKRAYFWTEFCFDTVSFGLLWFCLRVWGLTGAGMATFGSFLFYWIVIYFLVRRVTGFSWSKANVRLGLVFVPTVGAGFSAPFLLPPAAAAIAGGLITCAVGVHNLKMLHRAVGPEAFNLLKKKFRGVHE